MIVTPVSGQRDIAVSACRVISASAMPGIVFERQAVMVSPPSLPRQMPLKVTTAPMSVRPFVSADGFPCNVEIGFLDTDGHIGGHEIIAML